MKDEALRRFVESLAGIAFGMCMTLVLALLIVPEKMSTIIGICAFVACVLLWIDTQNYLTTRQ